MSFASFRDVSVGAINPFKLTFNKNTSVTAVGRKCDTNRKCETFYYQVKYC